MTAEPQAKPLQAPPPSLLPQEWAEKYARNTREIEQLRKELEREATELQLARSSQAECMTRCESLQMTVTSQELQMQAILSQSAAEKSSFAHEKEHLQLLFDKQQQLCVGLTGQVVALTANCERLQSQIDDISVKERLETEQFIKDIQAKDAVVALEQQQRAEAISRTQALEATCKNAEAKLAALESVNFEQRQKIELLTEELQAASLQVSKHEQNAAFNEDRFLQRRARGCQTVAQHDLDRCAFQSSVAAASGALQQLRGDCNQILNQFARDMEVDRLQISNLRHSLSEMNMELKRVVANAEQRSAQREQAFQNQLRASGSELRQQLTSLSGQLADAQEHCAVLQRTLAHAEREVQTYKVQIEAGALARQSHEMQIELLQQENGALDRNVIALRRVVAERHGLSDDCCSHAATASSSSSRDLALIAHLEARAKDSEQRAESMMFQRNEAQSRCQLAELSLDHFQRLCDSSLSLLRASVTSDAPASPAMPSVQSYVHISSASFTLPSTTTQHQPVSHLVNSVPAQMNFVPEAGQLLANAASRWTAEDIEAFASSSDDFSAAHATTVILLDEIQRLRLQLSVQHTRVIAAYAEGIKHLTVEQKLSAKA